MTVRAGLPEGFTVEDVALDGANLFFYGRDNEGVPGGYILNMQTGRIIAEIGLGR